MRDDRPIAVGIIGLGRAGWGMHGPEIARHSARFRIAACCDLLAARRERFAGKYGGATYARAEDLIADPAVELVDIATRTTEHVLHSQMALKAGKHVFVEKPMSTDYAGARQIARTATASKGKLFVRHNRRYEGAFQHAREIIASGILGRVYEIRLRRNGFARRDDWQTIKRCGGGQLLNWGPHLVDHALVFLESPVAKMWSDLKRIAAVGDAEDHVHIILTGRNGRVVDLEISGGAAMPEPEYFVLGTRGAMHTAGGEFKLRYLDPAVPLAARRAKAGTPKDFFGTPDTLRWIEETRPIGPADPVDLTSIWIHLHAAIRRGKPFPITTDHALNVMKILTKSRAGTPFA